MVSIRSKLIFGYALLAVVSVLIGSLYTIMERRTMLYEELKKQSHVFAMLSSQQLVDIYDTYYHSGFQKFTELTRGILKANPDLDHFDIIHVDGISLFSSTSLDDPGFSPYAVHPEREETDRLPFIQGVEEKTLDNYDSYVIYYPVIQRWGKHKYTIRFVYHYDRIHKIITSMFFKACVITIIVILLIVLLTIPLSNRITVPIRRLAFHAELLAKGVSFGGLEIKRKDEIGYLFQSFSTMASQITDQIEALKEMNEELERANEELKKLDEMKSALVANVSHELRTPLSAARGYVEYLMEKEHPKQEREKVYHIITRNLGRLERLIEGLIDLSFLEREAFPITLGAFSPSHLMEELRETYSGVNHPNSVSITFNLSIPEDLTVRGDEERILQVMENLINNAVKFNRPGGEVLVTIEKREDNALFSVQDTGIGMSKESVKKIGTRFFQVQSNAKRKYGGMGLGLSIASAILQGHGSRLSVESETGKGSLFSFTFPIIGRTAEHGGTEQRVLIMEDNKALADLIVSHLKKRSLDVKACHTFEDFQHTIQQEAFNVVILDLMLNGKRWDDELARMQGAGVLKEVSIIVVSAYKPKEGSFIYDILFKKPVSMERLMNAVLSLAKEEKNDQDDFNHRR